MEGYFPGLLYLTKALYGFEPRYNSKDKIEEEDDSKGILKEGDSVHHKFKSPYGLLFKFKDNIEIK